MAVIPARGGSKGVPGKNLREVGGVSLIGRSVRAAVGATCVDAVYVSTDDADIAAEARRHGAAIIERPAAIAGDTASSEAALFHALDVLAGQGIEPAILVFLQCTSVFTTPSDIDRCVGEMRRLGADGALSVTPSHGFIWKIGAEGFGHGVNHDETKQRKRRQDLEPEYLETGAIYVMTVSAFRHVGHRFCGRIAAVPVPHLSPEIDSESDLMIANALADSLAAKGD